MMSGEMTANDEDDEKYPDDKNLGTRVGATIRRALWWTGDRIHKNTLGFLFALFRVLPVIGVTFWRKLALRSLYLYHKRVGGDGIGIEAIGNEHADLVPVKYKHADQCEDDERPGWHAYGRDRSWKPSTAGKSTLRLGKTPIVPLDGDSWRGTSYLEARVSEAVDMGETRPLYRVDEAELTAEIDVSAGADAASGAGNGAMADGGSVAERSFDPRTAPIFEDVIIQLDSDSYDGQAVSWNKTKELALEQVGTDEMRRQEQRGYLAGMSREDWKSWAIKIMLIGAALAAMGFMGPEIINGLFGGGGAGGGGGSVIPFSTGALWGV